MTRKAQRKAARKFIQHPYSFAARYRGDTINYLSFVAALRSHGERVDREVVKACCEGHRLMAHQEGFRLP